MENTRSELTPLLLDSLYTEAMVLADEARYCLDRNRSAGLLSPEISVAFSCESLKVKTRLMHSIAWLLNQRALHAGEISEEAADSDANDLGYAPASDMTQLEGFPAEAQALIAASEELYDRLQRFSSHIRNRAIPVSEPRIMRERLLSSF